MGRVKLYTPLERASFRAAAAALLKRNGNVQSAADKLVQEYDLPLHDARPEGTRFVALTKQDRRKRSRDNGDE